MREDFRPSVAVVSFSHVAGDARVLRQIELLREHCRVTVIGYGDLSVPGVEMISVPPELRANRPYGRLLQLGLYRLAYWRQRGPTWVVNAVRGRAWSAVVANDIEAVPLALRLAPAARVHVDLHEYAPRMREHWPVWRRVHQPYIRWICRRFVRRTASQTTVSPTIAHEYEREFGFAPAVVLNAPPFREATPHPPGSPLRLVHSGGAMEHRGIEELCAAVEITRADVELDLYLVPADPAVLAEARGVAERCKRVRVLDPVPPGDLVEQLAQYDVGVHLLKPVNFNHEHALPNKVFDYLQARLAVITGPTAALSALVRESATGWVTEDFEPRHFARLLETLDEHKVAQAKSAAHDAAARFCSETQVRAWGDAVREIIARGGR